MNTALCLRTSGGNFRKDRQILVGIVQSSATYPEGSLKSVGRGDRGSTWFCECVRCVNKSGFERSTEGWIVLDSIERFLGIVGRSLILNCAESVCMETGLLARE